CSFLRYGQVLSAKLSTGFLSVLTDMVMIKCVKNVTGYWDDKISQQAWNFVNRINLEGQNYPAKCKLETRGGSVGYCKKRI
ncbi:MAG TPA: hypothetical protein DCG75_02870, partial [Bacteroidales bacterium]|nr:hypothetical protein [Bacteroidales bacterium]